ncbi:Dysferlin [Armadillidium nasatum]|uniref:Dysferlin n=1 Tax=Armadillidium nasatum TaxID=96803 RepID=A0A5N5SMK4_9CRUS|nr:Dysferlin [Armadillidium nasatum]
MLGITPLFQRPIWMTHHLIKFGHLDLQGTLSFVPISHTLTYLKEANRSLEIEVSIGNFGNKLEQSILPSPSSTHPSNPVFDGCRYYFLPWGDSSPLIMVQCQWEDITYRLMASNAISKIVKETRKNLRSIKQSMKSGKEEEEGGKTRILCQDALKTLNFSCKAPLPEPDPIRHALTSLDTALRKKRILALKKICKDSSSLISESAETIVDELQIIIDKLEDLALEPQNSIPDIFLWLMSGTERLAFARVPAQKILFAFEPDWSGEIAGHFTSFPLRYPDDSSGLQVGGVVRASLWLGREEDLRQWWDVRADLQLTVYAETFENQVVSAPGTGKWTNKGALMRRPPFSDADGLKELPKDMFVPSTDWKFQGDWFIDPDPSIKYSMDSGHTIYCEEVFEQQARVPGGTWLDAPNTWTDARGDPATPRDQIECPVGWQWRDLWATDLQRAVDCEGWEYTVQKGITGWSPQEKLYHVLRRRRWMRERHRVGKVEKTFLSKDGWEYATLFSRRFHARERGIDIVRRRRWRRKLVPAEHGIPTTPRIMVMTDNKDVKESVVQITCPRQYVVSTEIHLYQLRAHIYQARDLAAGDKSGLSDPYAVVSFCGSTQQTEKQGQTLCPTWDQTLVFDEIRISGPIIPPNEMCSPPSVVVEIYDWDHRYIVYTVRVYVPPQGEPDFLGRVICEPHANDLEKGYKPPKLQWYQLTRGGTNYGEILATFELFLKDPMEELPMPPPSKGDTFMLPFGIRPVLQKTRIEVLCWGIRNMSTFDLQSVTRPSIEFECGGQEVKSSIMNNSRQNPNFDNPHLYFDVELPKEELYMPPLTLPDL